MINNICGPTSQLLHHLIYEMCLWRPVLLGPYRWQSLFYQSQLYLYVKVEEEHLLGPVSFFFLGFKLISVQSAFIQCDFLFLVSHIQQKQQLNSCELYNRCAIIELSYYASNSPWIAIIKLKHSKIGYLLKKSHWYFLYGETLKLCWRFYYCWLLLMLAILSPSKAKISNDII